MKILAAQLNPTIGAFETNSAKILAAIDKAKANGCDLVVTPELALTGYPPEDLLLLPDFVEANGKYLEKLIAATEGIALIVGTVRPDGHGGEKPIYNSAAVISDRKLLGFQDKHLLPTYGVFDERRYFATGKETKIWKIAGKRVGITICEDIWRPSDRVVMTEYQCDPIEELKTLKPDVMVNCSASPYSYKKADIRQQVVGRASHRLGCPALLVNQVGGNDSLIFAGMSMLCGKEGEVHWQGKGFAEEMAVLDLDALPPSQTVTHNPLSDLYQALVLGVQDYFYKSGWKRALIGLSGGIDSSLVACIAVDALGANNVLGISMPSRYSTTGSKTDAQELAKNLGIECSTIPIEKPFGAYEDLLAPHFKEKKPDTTEENLQARIRGMILMAISNKHGYLVLSTGNKSEMAMGYATLYGDMCGGLSVINDVSKMQCYELCRWINESRPLIPENVLTKPPSAELAHDQKDSDSLPDYAIVDAVLEDYVEKHLSPHAIASKREFPLSLVEELIAKIHRNEYKRRQAPPGLRVTERAFSVGRRFPIVQHWK